MSARLLFLIACLGLVACPPTRRGGGGDDDDATDDDDDSTDDDDDVSTDGQLELTSMATNTVTLPARIGISRSDTLGMQATLLAGAAVSCDSFEEYSATVEEAYIAFNNEELDTETYIEIIGNALLQLIGPSSWAVLIQLDSSFGDPEAPIDLQTGDWDEPPQVTIGRLAATTEDPDLLAEGNTSGKDSFSWTGQVNAWSETGGLVAAFDVIVPSWGGPQEFDDVSVLGDISASVCLYESFAP